MSILEELYYGNLPDDECIRVKTPEYRNLTEKIIVKNHYSTIILELFCLIFRLISWYNSFIHFTGFKSDQIVNGFLVFL